MIVIKKKIFFLLVLTFLTLGVSQFTVTVPLTTKYFSYFIRCDSFATLEMTSYLIVSIDNFTLPHTIPRMLRYWVKELILL